VNLLSENQPWWQPYAELLFWVLLSISLMMFYAYHPSADDAIRGVVIGVVIAAWSQVTSKITELRTKVQERSRAARYMEQTAKSLEDEGHGDAATEIRSQVQDKLKK